MVFRIFLNKSRHLKKINFSFAVTTEVKTLIGNVNTILIVKMASNFFANTNSEADNLFPKIALELAVISIPTINANKEKKEKTNKNVPLTFSCFLQSFLH